MKNCKLDVMGEVAKRCRVFDTCSHETVWIAANSGNRRAFNELIRRTLKYLNCMKIPVDNTGLYERCDWVGSAVAHIYQSWKTFDPSVAKWSTWVHCLAHRLWQNQRNYTLRGVRGGNHTRVDCETPEHFESLGMYFTQYDDSAMLTSLKERLRGFIVEREPSLVAVYDACLVDRDSTVEELAQIMEMHPITIRHYVLRLRHLTAQFMRREKNVLAFHEV